MNFGASSRSLGRAIRTTLKKQNIEKRFVTCLSSQNNKGRITSPAKTCFYNPVVAPKARNFSSAPPSEISGVIKSIIELNRVVVFSKTWCGYSASAKRLFQRLGVEIEAIELDLLGNQGIEMQEELLRMTGQRTVPNVFVNGKHIGGSDLTHAAARSGKLQELLDLK